MSIKNYIVSTTINPLSFFPSSSRTEEKMIEGLLSEFCDKRMELLCVMSINCCFQHGSFRYRKNDSSDEIVV